RSANGWSLSQIAMLAPEATKRSVIARPNPCAPPVTMAQRPFRSILFIAVSSVRIKLSLPSFRDGPKDQTRNPSLSTFYWRHGFSDVQLHIRVRSLHSRPGMTRPEVNNHSFHPPP